MVKQENFFYATNGVVIKDRRELLDFLRTTDPATFSFHVNLERNDFSNWVREILEDKSLANKLSEVSTKEEMADLIEDSMKPRAMPKRDRKSVINRLTKVIKNG